jgi:hypothetical protein
VDIRIQCIVVDADDCERLARFWSQALGWRITYQSSTEWCIEPPEGSPEVDVASDILFVEVPDARRSFNGPAWLLAEPAALGLLLFWSCVLLFG